MYNRSFYRQTKPNVAAKRTINDKFNSSLLGEEAPEDMEVLRKAKEVAEQRLKNNKGKLHLGQAVRQKSAETGSRAFNKQRYKLLQQKVTML